MKMNPVVHFEMPAEDTQRMRDFYGKVFGWQTQQLGPEMGEYITVTTAETDENRMITKPGAINGGFYQKTDDPVSHSTSIVIQVDDIAAHMRMVEAAGGKINGKVEDIPGVGKWVSFIDTEGNRVSMLQGKG